MPSGAHRPGPRALTALGHAHSSPLATRAHRPLPRALRMDLSGTFKRRPALRPMLRLRVRERLQFGIFGSPTAHTMVQREALTMLLGMHLTRRPSH